MVLAVYPALFSLLLFAFSISYDSHSISAKVTYLFLRHVQQSIKIVETVNWGFLNEQRLSRRLIIERTGVDDVADKRHVALHKLGLGLLKARRVAFEQLKRKLVEFDEAFLRDASIVNVDESVGRSLIKPTTAGFDERVPTHFVSGAPTRHDGGVEGW